MTHEDRYGLPISTASEAAARAYRDGVDLMLAGWTGTAETLERAIAADPDFALAHVARARLHSFYQQGDLARKKAAVARELVAERGTERERSHVETLALAVEGRPVEALAATLKHIETWPRDAMVLALPLGAFGLFAFSGMADHDRARQELCEQVAEHYGEDWWFLTLYGWAMTENGDAARGRAVTERGFDLRRENAHAAHAVLHAMFEDGSIDEADRLVESWIPAYGRDGILHGHIRWHQALGALEHGDAAKALAIYADVLRPDVTQAPPLNMISDSASLLWRLAAYGHAVPKQLWTEADAAAQKLFPRSSLPFADVHMALFAAATQNREALAARLAVIEQRLADGKLPAGPVVPAICRAMTAFADEDFAECVRALTPVRADIVRIGGSHAQRELIEDTFIVALIRSGELGEARTMLDSRLHRRPSLRDTNWRGLTAG
jgi:hypothetical protein